jgi:hypothetical protein
MIYADMGLMAKMPHNNFTFWCETLDPWHPEFKVDPYNPKDVFK